MEKFHYLLVSLVCLYRRIPEYERAVVLGSTLDMVRGNIRYMSGNVSANAFWNTLCRGKFRNIVCVILRIFTMFPASRKEYTKYKCVFLHALYTVQ